MTVDPALENDSPPRRRPLRLAALLLVECVVVALLLEVALRVAYDRSPSLRRALYHAGAETAYDEARDLRELLESSPQGWAPRTRHGDFILNSRGLKTIEYSERKPDGCLRVVALGDSFTFASGGVPYDDLWHQQLRAALVERRGEPVEVLSLGVKAVGPDFYRRMWEVEGARLGADLVVVGIYIGNDFFDVRPMLDLAEERALDRWTRRSYLLQLVRNWGVDDHALGEEEREIRRRDAAAGTYETGGHEWEGRPYEYDPNLPSLSEERFFDGYRWLFRLFEPDNAAELEASFRAVRAQLAALAAETRDQGVPLVVMLIPTQPQVDPELAALLAERRSRPLEHFDLEAPNRLLRAWFDGEGLPYVDMLPLCRERFGAEQLYRRLDTHWSAAANRMAGRALAQFVLERGLVP